MGVIPSLEEALTVSDLFAEIGYAKKVAYRFENRPVAGVFGDSGGSAAKHVEVVLMSIHRFRVLAVLILVFAALEVESAKPVCGDGTCNGPETAASCSVDCDASGGFCGDDTCDATEDCASCESDCGVCPPATCNNDGICNLGEDCLGCLGDCAGVTSGKKNARYCCGGLTPESLYCGVQCDPSCGKPLLDPVCGNGLLESPEECDDGNTVSGDGCSASCLVETPECGNGVLESPEECDDGNTVSGDGCSSSCLVETPECGNGVLESPEECDDGNTTSGDGCDENCLVESDVSFVPDNQFNIGDSIGVAEAADGGIGNEYTQSVWSTGYDGSDPVNSLNERFETNDTASYYENNSARDTTFNHAFSGAVMEDFVTQAQGVVTATASTPTATAGQITFLLGNNDVCADDLASMTDIGLFEQQFRAGLEVLADDEATRTAVIHISSLPAIYWLWESRADTSRWSWCRLFAWPNVPCQNLLGSSGDDCESLASREDPDTIYPGDGTNCERRKMFHARIRDDYNVVLQDVVAEFATRTARPPMPNLEYIDIFDVRFDASHVNGDDCFHPSLGGHQLLSIEEYCRSRWSEGDSACAQ